MRHGTAKKEKTGPHPGGLFGFAPEPKVRAKAGPEKTLDKETKKKRKRPNGKQDRHVVQPKIPGPGVQDS